MAGYIFCTHANARELKTKVWKERVKQYLQSHQVPETSVYISSDKDIYIAGENLWYNAFILDPHTVELSELDHILYLQLVNTANDSTVWKEMYPVLHGTSSGHVYLAPTLAPGKYILRAYTAHSYFRDQKNLYAVTPIQIVKEPNTIKHNGQPVDETPFNRGKKLTINITGIKPTYTSKELVTLRITTTDETGKPMPAVITLKVYDRLFNNPASDHDILRYYYERKSTPLEKYSVIPDSIAGQITSKKLSQQSLMLFNYNKSITHFLSTDQKGKFYLDADNLAISQRFFIKYFSEKDLHIHISDPFDAILTFHPIDQYNEKTITKGEEHQTSNRLQYNNLLKEVTIKSKGREFGDPYLGFLDSIAKFEGNFDYVGQCGWLNCPACGSGTKPIEGVTYSELKPNKKLSATSHPFSFSGDDYIKQPYHYPKYTEEELLKKFKMVIAKGFYQHPPFYSPDYSKEDKQLSDTRNVLYWNPLIITDQNGEAILQFYTSDIQASFIGIAEGVSLNGYVGTGKLNFLVR
jgi:hypothetical protein